MEQQFSEAACERVLLPRRCKLLSYDREICLRTDVGPHLGSVIGVLAACISFHCSVPFTPALHPKHQTENSSSHPRTAQAVPSLTSGQEERAFLGILESAGLLGMVEPFWGWLGFGGCQRPTVGSGLLIPRPFDTVSFLAQTGPPTAPPELPPPPTPRQPSALNVQGTRSSLDV